MTGINKSKGGLGALREKYFFSVSAHEFVEAERQRNRTVRMLALLSIDGGSEPGNVWVRVGEVEVTLMSDKFYELAWAARRLDSTDSRIVSVPGHKSELLYRLGWRRDWLAWSLVQATERAAGTPEQPS